MPGRIRTVKPEFFTHEELYDLGVSSGFGPLVRLAFEGLWCQSDREGRFKWRPRSLKLAILPYDDCDFDALMQALVDAGFVFRYGVNGKSYGWIPSFRDHQQINNREMASLLPPHPGESDACPTRGSRVDDAPRGEPNGTEGKGREPNGTRVEDAGGDAVHSAGRNGRRYPGASSEWDKCLSLMDSLELDSAARSRVQHSSLDDFDLVRLLSDTRSDGRVKKPSAYVVKAITRMENAP